MANEQPEEKRLTYDSLQESRERFRQLFAYSGIGMALVAPNGRLAKVNPALCEFLGYSDAELLQKTFTELTHSDDIGSDLELSEQLFRGEISHYNLEKRYVRKDGKVVWGYLNAALVRDAEGRPLYGVGQVQDITERKQAFDAVRASERRFRAILEKSFDGIQLVSAAGTVQYTSPSTATILGYPPEDWLGKSIFAIVHPDDLSAVREHHHELIQTPGRSGSIVYRSLHKDGAYRWVESRATNLLDDPDVDAVVINFREITQAKRAAESEQRLRAERDALLTQLQLQVERMPIGLVMMEADLRITDWNPAAEDMFGYSKEAALGKQFTDFLAESSRERAKEIVLRLQAGDMVAHSLIDFHAAGGKTIRCEWYNTPILNSDGNLQSVLSMFIDVTERKRLECQVRQVRKMEALGKLAGGVAHDFNNILTVISGSCELLHSTFRESDEWETWTAEIQLACERATALTNQLLSFSRHQVLHQQILDLNVLIENMQFFLQRLIGEDIELTTTLEPSLSAIRADKHQLEQVIMNLAANARDAMPRGGQLKLQTKELSVPLGAEDQVAASASRYVQLTVADTGVGMDDATLEHLFEPFFTTKEIGRGTGLGLATVYGTINQLKGHIHVSSSLGKGTRFEILLPTVAEQPASPAVSIGRPARQGEEKILLVEDEAAVRITAAAMLKHLGYDVVAVAGGDEALQVVSSRSSQIDLLLTDVVMPDMSGTELYRQLRAIHPNVKVLFMSGYTSDRMEQHGIDGSRVPFLPKPFNQFRLAESVGRALVGESPPV